MTSGAQALNITHNDWKVTLPSAGGGGHAKEVSGADFDNYSDANYHADSTDSGGTIFTAPVTGFTTTGSKYPRSELNNDVAPDGLWDAKKGRNEMFFTAAFTHLPNGKGVVGAQVHGKDDDVSTFRLEGSKLYITRGDDSHYHLVTDSYVLGTKYTGLFNNFKGTLNVWYNGKLQAAIPTKGKGNYFKIGAYTQANTKNSDPDNATNYGQVHVYSVNVYHGPTDDV